MRLLKMIIHDGLGIDRRKVSDSVKRSMNAVKGQKDKLQNCEKVRRMKIRS